MDVYRNVKILWHAWTIYTEPFVFFPTTSVGMQVLLMNSTSAELVRNVPIVPITMNSSDDITQLVPSDGGEYIYALTAQQVRVNDI